MINPNELLFIVDENNQPLEPKPRHEAHTKGYWRRTAHIWIINNQNQILCQKRSLKKDLNPGKWESYFGGHLNPNQTYLEGAVKEVNEEVNLNLKKEDLTFFKIHKSENGRQKEFQAIYYITWNGNAETVNFEKEEIDQVKWVTISEITQQQQNPNWSIPSYTSDLLKTTTRRH